MGDRESGIEELRRRSWLGRLLGYARLTGPGYLQSAMTLGSGTAAACLLSGWKYGYKLLWVQPVAMFLGVMMLAALANIVLTKGERPYKSFGREIGKPLVFLWALGTVMASIIWHFPQYGLAAAAARDLGTMAGGTMMTNGDFTNTGLLVSFAVGFLILGINMFVVFGYGSSSKGIRLYEWFLRLVIAGVIIMFAIVVVFSISKIA